MKLNLDDKPERKMINNETYIFETGYEACKFAMECEDAFVSYTGTSWVTEEDGDWGVVVRGE
jgi:hypothetical protein